MACTIAVDKNLSTREMGLNTYSCIYLIIIYSFGHEVLGKLVDPSLSIIYGSGLNPTIVLPARYFYIQAVDPIGKNVTDTVGDVFKISITGLKGPCTSWNQVLDLHDGRYIVRYRLYGVCDGLNIVVKYNNKHVAQSPYRFTEIIYNEECYCPMDDFYNWQDSMKCPTIYSQIEQDLMSFKNVDMDKALLYATEKFNQAGSYSFCNYVILENQIYRKCYGQHVGFKMFMDNILLSMARKAILPNIELLVNLGDWPLIKKHPNTYPIPMFSWCGSNETYDIVMPTYDLTDSTLEMMGRVTLDMISVMSNTGPSWINKIPKGFWRGRDSRRERLDLVSLARKYPDLLNASITNFFFFQDEEKEYGPKVKHMSFFDFFQYKYQVNIDGTVASYRFPYLLGGDSLVLKQYSSYYEHFYGDLEPMFHYLPFKRDLSDLLEKIAWAQNNDALAYQISQNGRTFAQDNLMPEHIFCYHAALFEQFSKRIASHIKVRNDMEHVPQSSDNRAKCTCRRNEKSAKDEL